MSWFDGSTSSPSRADRRTGVGLSLLSIAVGGLIALILVFLIKESSIAFQELGLARVLTDTGWHPSEGSYDLKPMLAGTTLVATGALLLATPLAIGCAMFCRFYAPRVVGAAMTRVIEVLAGVPSVVFGLWGLMVVVPIIGHYQPPGASVLAGALVLALMILPTIALLGINALSRLPADQLHAAAAVGLSRWGIIRAVAWPNARPGLLNAVILGFGRAVGETMAVLMVCGNVAQTPDSLFAPVRTLTANIALEMGYAQGTHRGALFIGAVLMLLAAALLVALGRAFGRPHG